MVLPPSLCSVNTELSEVHHEPQASPLQYLCRKLPSCLGWLFNKISNMPRFRTSFFGYRARDPHPSRKIPKNWDNLQNAPPDPTPESREKLPKIYKKYPKSTYLRCKMFGLFSGVGQGGQLVVSCWWGIVHVGGGSWPCMRGKRLEAD